MRFRVFIIGMIGLLMLAVSLFTFISWLGKKIEKSSKKYLLVLMMLVGLVGAGLFGVMSKNYLTLRKNGGVDVEQTANQVSESNAKERLMLPTAYSTVEATHPSVYVFDKAWNGYKYWMAVTPYPKGDAAKENPHVFVSNDLITWLEPKEGMNPLDEVKSEKMDKDAPLQYNSDTHLVYNEEENRIEVYWRYVDDVNDQVTIYRRNSSDGQSFEPKEIVYQAPRKKADWVSPAFVKDKDGYKVWYVANGYKMWYRESEDGLNWSEEQEIKMPYAVHADKMYHWHIDVQKIDEQYEALVSGFEKQGTEFQTSDRHVMSLYYSTSKDGKEWKPLKEILAPSHVADAWDGKGLYRSCFVKDKDEYLVFYSGIGFDDTRGIGISHGPNMQSLEGIDYSHLTVGN